MYLTYQLIGFLQGFYTLHFIIVHQIRCSPLGFWKETVRVRRLEQLENLQVIKMNQEKLLALVITKKFEIRIVI